MKKITTVAFFCFAPIHADTNSGELIYTPSYYYIGHFSKFIRPDAKRVGTAVSRSSLLSTLFLNTDGKMVTVVMNQSNKSVTYNLNYSFRKNSNNHSCSWDSNISLLNSRTEREVDANHFSILTF